MKRQVPQAPAPAPKPKRKRNGVATREAILQSAQIAFSRLGYDGVGVREIAREAGVTAVLVNRYFGSKEALFAEVVRSTFAKDASLNAGVAILSRNVADQLVIKGGKGLEEVHPLLLTLRSAANDKAVTIMRASIAEYFEKPLAAALGAPLAAERAALIIAVIGGFELVRRILVNDALASADEKELTELIAELLESLIAGGRAKS